MHKSLQATNGNQKLRKLGDALRKEHGHRATQDVVVGSDEEGPLGIQDISQQDKGNQTGGGEDARQEHGERDEDAADVVDLLDAKHLIEAGQLHHLAEWLLPGVHLDHLDARDDLVHHPDTFVRSQGGAQAQHAGPLTEVGLKGQEQKHYRNPKNRRYANL